jgi:putative ABC transport system permease protein
MRGGFSVLRLVLGAIRRRRTQALLLFLLGAVAATVAAAAPAYIAASSQSLAASNAGSANTAERIVSVSGAVPFDGVPADQLDTLRSRVAQTMVLPGFRTVFDARLLGVASGGNATATNAAGANTTLAYRDGFCEQVVIDGRCPTAPGEVVLSPTLASKSGLKAGGTITFTGPPPAKPLPLAVVGVFRARAPYDTYWGRSLARGDEPVAGGQLPDVLMLTSVETLRLVGSKTGTVSADLIATPESFRQTDPQLLIGAVQVGAQKLQQGPIQYQIETGMQALTDRTWDDQQLVYVGVPVGAVELLLLCWFALFLAVRQTGEERRLDVAKLKLHGSRRRDIWFLIAGQSIVPLLLGGLVGLPAGLVLARVTAGPVDGAELARYMVFAAFGTAALAILGAVFAALLAERRILGESVADLGRQVGARRSGWRAGLFDLGVGVLAVAAAYQLGTGKLAGTRLGGLALAAPLLLALIAGLLTSRLVPVLAGALSPGLFRASRIGSWLVSAHLSRRAGRSRVLALLTLALAVLGSTALAWGSSTRAREDRAMYEVGTDRVLTVQAPTRSALLAGVRAADPSGRYAMAAVQTYGTLRVLAVDTTRLAAVVPWQAQYGGGSWSDIAARLRPATPAPVMITGTGLTLTAGWQPAAPPPQPVSVVAQYVTGSGTLGTVRFGPLQTGSGQYQATVPNCSGEHPCRLVSVALAGPAAVSGTAPVVVPPAAGSTVTLTGLAQTGPAATVVGADTFGDRTRWRNDVRSTFGYGQLSTGTAGLSLSMSVLPSTDKQPAYPGAAYLYDAASPLPVIQAGTIPPTGDIGDPRVPVFGDAQALVSTVGTLRLVPRLGRNGVLTDLEYGDRLLPDGSTVGTMEVWLAAGAPADLVDRLAVAGISVASVDSAADRLDQLGAQGPVVALRFLLLVGVAGALLAVMSFAVWAGSERALRGQELKALRWQGLPRRTTRVAALGGYLALVGCAVVVGVVVALVLRSVDSSAVFADGFDALTDPPPDPVWVLGLVGATTVALTAAAILAGRAVLHLAGQAVLTHPEPVADPPGGAS